jgi:hypothetical protein
MNEIISSLHQQTIGQWLQFAGAGAFAVGALLSLHHIAIAACVFGGAAAFYAGRKLREGK